MNNIEMIIAQNMGAKAEMTDYYSYAQETPYKILIPLTLINSTIGQGIVASFSRPLSYAYLTTNSGFQQHNYIGSGVITFGTTQGTSSFLPSGGDDFFKTHGVYMTIMWVAIVQVGVIVMRYFKW